jgi:hypothetical protein
MCGRYWDRTSDPPNVNMILDRYRIGIQHMQRSQFALLDLEGQKESRLRFGSQCASMSTRLKSTQSR